MGGHEDVRESYHCLVLEGVYTTRESDGAAVFHPVRPTTTEEVAQVAAQVAARVRGLLERHGLLLESEDSDTPALDAAQGAALFGGVAFGPRAGKKVRQLGTGVMRPRRERPPL